MARIICDVFKKENKQIWGDNPNDDFNQKILVVNNMYAWLYENGLMEKFSFEFQDLPKETVFALDAEDLIPYRQEMENSGVEGAALAVRHIFDEEYTPCLYSGAIQLGWTMFSYRNVDGCVGRSWECDLIKGLNTESIYEVNKVQREQGIKAAVKAMFTYYNWPVTEKSNVRDWYVKAYPTDDLASAIQSEVSFRDIVNTLNDNKDIYDVLGVGIDTFIRERVFQKTSEIFGVDYNVIYKKWLYRQEAPDIPTKDKPQKSSLDSQIQSADKRAGEKNSVANTKIKEPEH